MATSSLSRLRDRLKIISPKDRREQHLPYETTERNGIGSQWTPAGTGISITQKSIDASSRNWK